jgi:hypothetical protein
MTEEHRNDSLATKRPSEPRPAWTESVAARLLGRAFRIFSAIAGLYACVFLLQYLSGLPAAANSLRAERASSALKPGISLREGKLTPSVDAPVSRDAPLLATLTGNASGRHMVEIRVGKRTFRDVAEADGSVSTPIELTESASQVEAIVEDGSSAPPSTTVPIEARVREAAWGRLPPTLDLAILDQSSKHVWLVGRALGWRTDGSLHEWGHDWYFERWVPFEPSHPTPLSFQSLDRIRVHELQLEPAELAPYPELPLSRALTVRYEPGAMLMDVEISLPVRHPAFVAFARGNLTAQEFVRAVWGLQSVTFDMLGRIEQKTTREGALAHVKLNGSLDYRHSRVSISSSRSANEPIRPETHLLFTSRDSITIQFNQAVPRWFGSTLPTRLAEGEAEWRGPLEVGSIEADFELAEPKSERASDAPDSEQQPPEAAPDRPAPTVRDWIENGARNDWLPPLDILPLLLFSQWAWRRPFGRRGIWPPVFAAASVLLGFGLATWVHALLRSTVSPWLPYLFLPYDTTPAFQLDENAFFLGLTALTALFVPEYFRRAERYAQRKHPLPRARGRFRRALTVIRFLWAAPWLLLSAALIASHESEALRRAIVEFMLGSTAQQSAGGCCDLTAVLQQSLAQNRAIADELLTVWRDPWLSQILALGMAAPALLAIGVRAFVFGLGGLFAVLRASVEWREQIYSLSIAPHLSRPLERFTELGKALEMTPWTLVLALVGLSCIPLVTSLLRALAVRDGAARRLPATKAAVLLVVASLMLGVLPTKLVVAAAGCVMLVTLAWALLRGARRMQPATGIWLHLEQHRLRYALASLLVALLLAWPTLELQQVARMRDLYDLYFDARYLFRVLTAGLLLLLLKSYSDQHPGAKTLPPPLVAAGPLLFAVFVNRNVGTWLEIVPIPILTAWWLARQWLFQNVPTAPAPTAPSELPERRSQIAEALASSKARYGLEAAEQTLEKKLRAGEFLPDEYDRRLSMYRRHYASRITTDTPDAAVRLLPFSVSELTPWETGRRFAVVGSALAAVPLVIALYQYLPTQVDELRYPRLRLATFLIGSSVGWLLIAFFLGFFFNHIRGRNGLQKGLALCACLVAASLAVPLLTATPLAELQSTFIWAMMAFAFCGMLGGVEDYRTLRDHGFRLRDLAALHDFPWLSVYASSIAAALISGGLSLLSGKLGDVAKLFAAGISSGAAP